MSERRAVRIPVSDAPSLGKLRLQPGLAVCQEEDVLWLRAENTSEELELSLRSIPGLRYDILNDEQLVLQGELVPKGHLPKGPWTPLVDWLEPEMPAAGFGGEPTRQVELQLVRGGVTAECNVLFTEIGDWQKYASTAAQVRLDRLVFATSAGGQTVIRGTPLPPLPGIRFVEESGVAVPAGWRCEPPLDADVLAEVLGLADGELALLHGSGDWDRIPADGFVRASRSAARLSAEAVADG